MNTVGTFTNAATACSRVITAHYSTSFSLAIKLLHKGFRRHIHAIYGFVRLADEIVDTFHDHNKKALLEDLKKQTFDAINSGISLNPVLQSFQHTVNLFSIPPHLISTFLHSMEMDLEKKRYESDQDLSVYIHGSAEVVGLMCLKVFCEGDQQLYAKLEEGACKLGAAFQKINFLRDLEDDNRMLQRNYFPQVDINRFDLQTKKDLEADIKQDFDSALEGILGLPAKARFGVYLAYRYYLSLFKRIRRQQPSFIVRQRVRVSNFYKLIILLDAGVRNQIGYW
jgi:15-cis-phytoene synthase